MLPFVYDRLYPRTVLPLAETVIFEILLSTPEEKCIGFPEQKCISEAGKKGQELGAFPPCIRLASDYPPGCQHWRGVSGAYSD